MSTTFYAKAKNYLQVVGNGLLYERGNEMNNLKYLREKTHLSLRQLSKECGLSDSLLSLLESEKRMWRLSHIETLTNFFKVSSDFILGKSNYGILVEIKSGFTAIDKEQYEEYLSNNLIKEYVQYGSVWRIPDDKLEEQLDPTINQDIREEITNEMKTMSRKELEKVLKFIKEFVK